MNVIYKSGKKGYIFRCTNETEDECFKRMLFGEIPKYIDKVKNINIGDSLFLLNVSSGRFYGEFQATSRGQLNIVKEAWGGRFPCQVKVKRVEEYPPISKSDLQKVVEFKTKFKGTYPEAILDENQIEKLRILFIKQKELPKIEEDFRKKYPNKIRTKDGHFVRSLGELTIDDWLFDNNIVHGYERRLPIEGENRYCDFYLKDKDKYVYMEYWGLEDEEYLKKKQGKIEIYKKNNLPLVELERRDLDNLDEILTKKLLKYFLGHRF